MSNCLCDVVRLLSCCVTCHQNQEVSREVQSGSTCRSGSPPGSAIYNMFRICNYLWEVGPYPREPKYQNLSQGTGLSKVHLFRTKMDQKDPPNLVFALDNTFSVVGAELDIHSRRGGGVPATPFPGTPHMGLPQWGGGLCHCFLQWLQQRLPP